MRHGLGKFILGFLDKVYSPLQRVPVFNKFLL